MSKGSETTKLSIAVISMQTYQGNKRSLPSGAEAVGDRQRIFMLSNLRRSAIDLSPKSGWNDG
jgi:hypothetical protein